MQTSAGHFSCKHIYEDQTWQFAVGDFMSRGKWENPLIALQLIGRCLSFVAGNFNSSV